MLTQNKDIIVTSRAQVGVRAFLNKIMNFFLMLVQRLLSQFSVGRLCSVQGVDMERLDWQGHQYEFRPAASASLPGSDRVELDMQAVTTQLSWRTIMRLEV